MEEDEISAKPRFTLCRIKVSTFQAGNSTVCIHLPRDKDSYTPAKHVINSRPIPKAPLDRPILRNYKIHPTL